MGIFSTLIGGAINTSNQREAMWNNNREAEKNRQFQEAMMDKSYNQSVDFWNMQNEYNSPANQVARMKEAGINPALSGAITPGMASGGVSTSAPGAQGSASPVSVAASGITDSILKMVNNKKQMGLVEAQANKLNSDATLDKIDAQTKLTENLVRIDNMRESTFKTKAERATIDAMRSVSVQGAQAHVVNTMAQAEESAMRTISGFAELRYLPKQKHLEFSEKIANIAALKASGQLSTELAKEAVQRTIHEEIKGQGQKYQNELAKKIEDYVIMAAYWNGYPKNLVQAGYELGDTAARNIWEKMKNTDWKNIEKRGYPKPWD